MMKPEQIRLVDNVVSRLPAREIISHADFRTALNLHFETAQAMIDGQEVVAMDCGTRSKSYWRITRESAVLLVHRRVLGIKGRVR